MFAHYRDLSPRMLDQLFWKQLYWFAMNCSWKMRQLFVIILFSSRWLKTAWFIAYLLFVSISFQIMMFVWLVYNYLNYFIWPSLLLRDLTPSFHQWNNTKNAFRLLNPSEATERESRQLLDFPWSEPGPWCVAVQSRAISGELVLHSRDRKNVEDSRWTLLRDAFGPVLQLDRNTNFGKK